jgi:hypothetical protein
LALGEFHFSRSVCPALLALLLDCLVGCILEKDALIDL